MKKVLFVCLGNICRSPLAQGIFEHHIDKQGLSDAFYTESAGTSAWHSGEPPQNGSITAAAANGIDISKQRSRAVRLSDRQEFDWFVAMDQSNEQSLLSEFSVPKRNVILLRNFGPATGDLNVPDPYSMGQDSFNKVFKIIDDCMPGLIQFLNNEKV